MTRILSWHLSNPSIGWVALAAALVAIPGCAGPAERQRGSAWPASARHAASSVGIAANPGGPTDLVELRDPLAADVAAPLSAGRHYQRFVTARLDGMAEAWHGARRDAWNAWADRTLQDGDLVFIQSSGNMVLGVIDFSTLIREVTGSPFNHMGLVAVEDGRAVVYDIVVSGPRRKTFGQLAVLSDLRAVAVKRLRPEYQQHIAGAVDYCRRVHQRQLGFDKKFRLDNDTFYCSELIEVAYRSTGLRLSQPVRWDTLPGFDEHSVPVNAVRLASQIQTEDYVVVPGNDEQGIWASPALNLVLDLTDVTTPPALPR